MQKRPFKPLQKGEVRLYVCGPTVYDDAHLGHAKSALTFDLLVRILEANGYSVRYARNITDIDDKIIKKAAASNSSIEQITAFYTSAYNAQMAQLGIRPPSIEPKATHNIDAMVEMIQKLLKEGCAYYTKRGDIYFDTSKDARYLTLSRRNQEEQDRRRRIEANDQKRHAGDFALWKAASEDEVGYESVLGRGRPGWHIECSAMIERHLAYSDTPYAIDIHGGGADLLFPHHENEAAQTRCATHKELAAYWMHNGFVRINGEKMSKSLGNSFYLKDALKEYGGELLRLYLLSTHYRSDFNFSSEDLAQSKKRLDRLYRLKKRLFDVALPKQVSTPFSKELLEALSDDLNTSKALSLIDARIAYANEQLDSTGKHKALKKELRADLAAIETLLGLGAQDPFSYFQSGIDAATKEQIEQLIVRRDAAKKARNFAKADAIREEILKLGVQIMDTPRGTFWEKV